MAVIVALIGLPGSGKSAVAPVLAAGLDCAWADLDERIAAAAGVSVPDLLRRDGEAAFRAIEEALLRRALEEAARAPGVASRRPGLVLSCGGGVVTAEGSRSLLRGRSFAVWLRVAPSTAAARLGPAAAGERPLLSGSGSVTDRLASLLARRESLYRDAAQLVVETDGRTPTEVAAEIERTLEGRAWDRSGS